MTNALRTWPAIVLLSMGCGVAGSIIAAYMPFSFEQAVVRKLTGATMPTTSRGLGKTVYHGSAAMIGALAGLSAGVALRWSRLHLWLAAASWLAIAMTFAFRYFPMELAWVMFPLGHMALLAAAHLLAARRLARDSPFAAPATPILRQPAVWVVTVGLLLGVPCTVAFPFAGVAFGPMPRLLYYLVTSSTVAIAGAILWTIFFAVYAVPAFLTAIAVARAWRLLSPAARLLMAALALMILTLVGWNFPMRCF